MRIVGRVHDHQLNRRIREQLVQCPANPNSGIDGRSQALLPLPYRIELKLRAHVQKRSVEHTPRHSERTYRRVNRCHIDQFNSRVFATAPNWNAALRTAFEASVSLTRIAEHLSPLMLNSNAAPGL